MLELTVGSRFWYKDKLYEVATHKKSDLVCPICPFNDEVCIEVKCSSDKQYDNEDVYFKEVK